MRIPKVLLDTDRRRAIKSANKGVWPKDVQPGRLHVRRDSGGAWVIAEATFPWGIILSPTSAILTPDMTVVVIGGVLLSGEVVCVTAKMFDLAKQMYELKALKREPRLSKRDRELIQQVFSNGMEGEGV